MRVIPAGKSPKAVFLEDIDASELHVSLGGARETALDDTPWQRAWVEHMLATVQPKK